VSKIELTREDREDALRRLRAYLEHERDEEWGDLATGLLYDFIAEELAPYFFNRGLHEAQSHLARFADSLDADLEAAKRYPPRTSVPRGPEAEQSPDHLKRNHPRG
jgi:uncharacterized protein (DUF2164 family)